MKKKMLFRNEQQVTEGYAEMTDPNPVSMCCAIHSSL